MFQKISNMLLTKNGIIFVIAVALFLIFVAEIKTLPNAELSADDG